MASIAHLRLRKAGGSLIATIPKDVVEREQLEAGDVVTASFETRTEALRRLIGSIPELADYEFDRTELWGPDRY